MLGTVLAIIAALLLPAGTAPVPGPFALRPDATLAPAITAPSAIAIDASSGAVLYAQAADERRPIGSITKLMTALVFLDTDPDLNAFVTLTAQDHRPGATSHFRTGERVLLADLLGAALIASDNDAAVALARSTGLREEQFVEAMNAKARLLGLRSTVFTDPTGLDRGNVSTAREAVALLQAARSRHALELLLGKSSGTAVATAAAGKKVTEREVRYLTTNQLVGGPYQIRVGKTGYIDESRYCLVLLSADPAGREVYGAILGSATLDDRFRDMKTVLDWVYQSYLWN